MMEVSDKELMSSASGGDSVVLKNVDKKRCIVDMHACCGFACRAKNNSLRGAAGREFLL
jgi:hypothetical protein